MDETTLIRKARKFAERAHKGVNRKYTGEPYITHPVRVYRRVSAVEGISVEARAAALLHDVVEDTEYTKEDIAERFGPVVGKIVEELTNPSKQFPHLTRAERKKMDRQHIARVSWEAKVVKLADRIDNVRGVVEEDGFSSAFVRLYRAESRSLFRNLRNVDSDLEQELEELLQDGNL
jgi:(p)ppGpp synthase/HD superfamily hydrolase